MNLILTLVFLVALAVVGKYFFQKIPLNNLFSNFLNYSGFYYLLMGVLFGPFFLNIFTEDVNKHSHYVFSLVLGWTGFLVGLQLNFKQMNRFQRSYYFNSIFYFLLHILFVGSLLLLINCLKIINLSVLELILLSVVGSITSTITIALLAKTKKLSTQESHFLEFLAAFDNVLGIIVLGFLFMVFNILESGWQKSLVILGSAYLVVVFLAFVYKLLAKELKSFETQILVILALILIVVSSSKILQNSILFLSVLLGLIISNFKDINVKKLYLYVQEWEKPLNFILLFFIGIVLQLQDIYYLAITFFIVVVIANVLTERIVFRNFTHSFGFQTFGLSSVSLAITLDAYLSGARIELLTIVVLIYFLTNILSIYHIKRSGIVAE
ncbi:cation:proton antiporter domain-containing protein [Caldithrix abyssi]|uniref:Sodium/hydrogen exchanger n=1 Tax=Caldithrix abyssi DSM 13497 TaxID=880073 RepID=H1XV85_CALAY|nr:cation:proton antiporter [Caldithrix abyssi]APF20957.1 sodium/hydrogen exchanger [Caldithrix abyssi DSM 13497]EHO40591.1 sodium/hydrogen exchanger [Caldithrix abyssi DSM 13497]